MDQWNKPIKFLYQRVQSPLKKLKLYIKHKLGWLGKPRILPYIGFGNPEVVYIRGRIVEDRELSSSVAGGSIWNNIMAMANRYISDEIPFVTVRAEFYDQHQTTQTNEFGEFEFTFHLFKPIPAGQSWHQIRFTLEDEELTNNAPVTEVGEIMISRPESKYGIISDIDDTILISHSTSLTKKLRLMLLKNATTRLPFEGVAAFYRALHRGEDSLCVNPLFYVSSSEWNLYDLLIDFCEHQRIPKGTFMLHDLKVGLLKMFKSGRGKHDHKAMKIRHILTTFEHLKFILIGDSGQRDPEIYTTIAEEYPSRIMAIYIRNVSSHSRDQQVKNLADKVNQSVGVEMLLVKDTEAAALHAIDKGFIRPETLIDIARERYKDQYYNDDIVTLFSGHTVSKQN